MQPPSRPLATRRAALGIAGGELVQRLAVLFPAAQRYRVSLDHLPDGLEVLWAATGREAVLAPISHVGIGRRYLATPTVDCAAITNRAVARLAFANLGPLPHVGLNRGGVWVVGTAEVIGSGRRHIHRLVGLDRGGARAVSNCVRAVQAVAVLAIGVGARVGLDRGRGGRRVSWHEVRLARNVVDAINARLATIAITIGRGGGCASPGRRFLRPGRGRLVLGGGCEESEDPIVKRSPAHEQHGS